MLKTIINSHLRKDKMTSLINNFDTEIMFFIYSKLHFPILDKLMILITSLGDKGMIWIIIGLILLINKKTRVAGILTLATLGLSAIIGEGILKPLFQRPRPYSDYPTTLMLIDQLTSFSFPSGHTSSSFAAAYILSKFFKKWTFVLGGFAIVMGFSRMYLFMHYPTDVIVGALLGLVSGIIVNFFYETYLKKKELRFE